MDVHHPPSKCALTLCAQAPPNTPEPHPSSASRIRPAFTRCGAGEAHPLRPYWEYLCFLFRRLPTLNDDARAEAEFCDYLQAPLQPLQVSRTPAVALRCGSV